MVDNISNPALPADSELTPERYEYIAADKVRVTLKTNAGGTIAYTMKAAALVQSVNMSVALINNFSGSIFRDLDIF